MATPHRTTALARIDGELASAARTLSVASERLNAARKRFEQGSARTLARLIQRKDELQEKLKENDRVAASLRDDFAPALLARGRRTGLRARDVQAFLRNAEETDAALREALAGVNAEIHAARADATELHRDYLAAYDAAYAALARQRAWQALAAHGQPIAEAIALLACVPLASDALTTAGGAIQISRANFVWHELTRLAAEASAGGPTDPGVEHALGTLDTTPFAAPNALLSAHALMRLREQVNP